MSRGCRQFTIVASLFVLAVAGAQETATRQQPVDPTPPPRGTTSFVPLPDLDKEPLTPQTFVVRAAVANMHEIELGEMALARAKDPAVVTFARQLVNEHRAANEKLRQLAIAQKVSMPGAVDEDHRKQKQELAKLSGPEFERRYIDHLNQAHTAAVALFQAATRSSTLPEPMREYADESLASVQDHRRTAQGLKE